MRRVELCLLKDEAPRAALVLALRRELVALAHGHDLLDRKRELLTRLVRQRLSRYGELRRSAKPRRAADS